MYISKPLILPKMMSLILMGLLSGSFALALTAEVRDDAKFFSPSAVQKANDVIQEIRQRFQKDLLIETVKTLPTETEQAAKSADPKVRKQAFSNWARSRARDAHVNGIYVLICRRPGHLELAVGDKTRQSGEFPSEAESKLNDLLLSHFRRKDYDNGLIAAAEFVRGTLAQTSRSTANAAGRVQHAAPSSSAGRYSRPPQASSTGNPVMKFIIILLVVGLAIWIFRAIARGFSRSSAPGAGMSGTPGMPGAGGMGMGGGGSGFLSGMLGGLFGAAAGYWLYDNVFRGSSASQAPFESQASAAGPGEGRQEDTDYSTSGSDFDTGDAGGGDFDSGSSDSGGGDFDSGDFGGGDFGGGDFGGGDG